MRPDCQRDRLVPILIGVTLVGTAVMIATMAGLHVLAADLNPITQAMSYYGPGPYGFVFTISLAAIGVSLAALTVALRRGLAPVERSAVALTFVRIQS